MKNLIGDEPWFTYHTDHADGIERTDLQLALCELAKYVRQGLSHYEGDGCLAYGESEEVLDRQAAGLSAALSPNEQCRTDGHDFPKPWQFRDICARCGCVRLLRGNPSRHVYEYPPDDRPGP